MSRPAGGPIRVPEGICLECSEKYNRRGGAGYLSVYCSKACQEARHARLTVKESAADRVRARRLRRQAKIEEET